MNPTTSEERKSRRSSILKPPKPRVPLQNVELDVSSNENSPAPTKTAKVKRRVSFAEKKHVKEFCDSPEQGTVWDNTYEESELGQIKPNKNSKNDENTRMQDDDCNQVSMEETLTGDLSVELESKSMEKPDNNTGISKDNQSKITVYHDTWGEMTGNIIPEPPNKSRTQEFERETLFFVSEEKTTFQMKTVEISTKISGIFGAGLKAFEQNEIDLRPERIPIFHRKDSAIGESTLNVSTSTEQLKILQAERITPLEHKLEKLDIERSTVFHNQGVDRTESSTNVKIIENQEKSSLETHYVFNNKSLDFTETVGHGVSCEKSVKLTPEKTTTLVNDSVEITGGVVHQRDEKTENPLKLPEEKTTIFANQSVDMTRIIESGQRYNEMLPLKLPEEKTTIFDNQSVDMTRIIESGQRYDEMLPLKLPEEKTTIFDNQSVDMTRIIESGQRYNEMLPLKLPEEKTTIFDNQSVDMTRIIESGQRYDEMLPLKLPEEKTTIFDNQSVDTTRIIESGQRYNEIPPLKLPEEKTTIFHNQSVDMTRIIEIGQRYDEMLPLKLPEEKTTIFNNQSVDTTRIIESGQRYNEIPPLKLPEEKTTIFHNQSVDMTRIIESGQRYDEMLPLKLPEEKTTIFHNQSVDMTAGAVNWGSRYENPLKLPQEKTTIFHDQSIDITEAVQSGRNYEIPSKKLAQEKTTIFHNESVDMTGVVRGCWNYDNPLKVGEEKTTIFANQSVDMTGVVQSNHESPIKVTQEKTAVFDNEPVEMTEAVGSRVPCVSKFLSRDSCTLAVERMAKHKPLELEEANRWIADYEAAKDPEVRSPAAKRMNMMAHDDSMEITRAIPGVLQARTAVIHGQTRQRIPTEPEADRSNEQILPETDENLDSQVTSPPTYNSRTTVFREDPMELTTAVRITSQERNSSSVSAEERNPLADEIALGLPAVDEKTMVYRDDSMDSTITRGVPFSRSSQLDVIDKENCPLGLSSRSRKSNNSSRVGTSVSKDEFLEILKSVPFLGSQERQSLRIESEEQRNDIGPEEMTGVVPFVVMKADDKSEELERVAFGTVDKVETRSRDAPRSSGVTLKKDKHLWEFPDTERFSQVNRHRPSSSVAKELFQKPVGGPSETDKTVTLKVGDDSAETPDLDAEIRKLAESFGSPVDESGFDQETFLRQQARCMEDYEANSTASQEYNSERISARKNNEPFTPKMSVSPDPARKKNDPKESVSSWAVSTDSKTADTSVHNKENFIAENLSSSIIDRAHYDKSLEELRHRAYSVRKFRPEITGFEFTAAINTADAEKLHESISAEEPPSFVFADSLSNDADKIDQTDCSGNELSIDKRKKIQSGEPFSVQLPDITETMKLLRNDTVERKISDISELTTMDVDVNECTNNWKNEKTVDKSVEEDPQRTYAIKRGNTEFTIPIPSSPEIDRDTNNERLSGVTTAAEFSTESPDDGPYEKLRREENHSIESKELPTVYIEGNSAMELDSRTRSWGNRPFVNSTVIGDDLTRPFIHPDKLREMSITPETTLSDQLPAEIAPNVGKTASPRRSYSNTANEIAMELNNSVPKSPFAIFKETVESLSTSPQTIWRIKRFDEKIVVFNFFSKTILLVVYLNQEEISNPTISPIKRIGLLSQLVEEGTDPGVCLAHSVIMKKVDPASLADLCQTFEDVPRLLEYVSDEVKLGMDFLFDLDRLRNRTIMKFDGNRISFVVRTRDINAGIILNITMEIKPFEQINSNDISVAYLLGPDKVREHDIKRLITNVKRDHRFLRFYIKDVQDYLDLMAETGYSNRVGAEFN